MIPDILLAKPMYRKHTNQNCLFTFIGLWFIVLDLGVIVFHMFSSHCLSSRLHNCLLISTVSTVIRIIFISFFLLYFYCIYCAYPMIFILVMYSFPTQYNFHLLWSVSPFPSPTSSGHVHKSLSRQGFGRYFQGSVFLPHCDILYHHFGVESFLYHYSLFEQNPFYTFYSRLVLDPMQSNVANEVLKKVSVYLSVGSCE